jgi:hypothetical protein
MLAAEYGRLGVEVVFDPLCTLQLACSVHPHSPVLWAPAAMHPELLDVPDTEP